MKERQGIWKDRSRKNKGQEPKGTDLCRPCMEYVRAEGKNPKLVYHGINKKVTCSRCGRRRYGATYTV